jgi:hypothetical protein
MAATNEKDPRDLLRALERIALDPLDPEYPKELVDEDLREMGEDPDDVGRRGAALAAKLLAERREALRRESVAGVAPLAERLAHARARPKDQNRASRAEMLERIAHAEADPRYQGQFAAAARGRRPDEPTDEELAAICEKLEALGILPAEGGGRGS